MIIPLQKPLLTAHKMTFSINDFSSKCGQIPRKQRIWSHLLNKSLMENVIFCAVTIWTTWKNINNVCCINWNNTYSSLEFWKLPFGMVITFLSNIRLEISTLSSLFKWDNTSGIIQNSSLFHTACGGFFLFVFCLILSTG